MLVMRTRFSDGDDRYDRKMWSQAAVRETEKLMLSPQGWEEMRV
jgi:hypothetical protein